IIDNTKVAATLTNFPVLLTNILDGNFNSDFEAVLQADWDDIRFTSDRAGTVQLAADYSELDVASGDTVIWVKVPSISSSTDTEIWAWGGDSGASRPSRTDTYGNENAWDSNFQGVWHLGEDPSGGAPQVLDATSNTNDGTSGGTMLTEDLVSAQIADGLDFDGSDDFIGFGANPDLSNWAGITVEVWLKWADTGSNEHIIFSNWDGNGIKASILFRLEPAGNIPQAFLIIASNTQIGGGATVETIPANTFTKITVRYNKTDLSIWVDGVKDATTFSGTANLDADVSGNEIEIGRSPHGGGVDEFDGIIDEVFISDTGRSDSWITTGYNNQSSPS
ncbi:hypothetical protein LCGC14_3160010, partial [marine sediment metagenome]